MVVYEKQYEDYFRRPENNPSINLDLCGSCQNFSVDEYINKIRKFEKECDATIFKMCVMVNWLKKSFRFDGKEVFVQGVKPEQRLVVAWGNFMRWRVGRDSGPIFSLEIASLLSPYMEEFFPNFFLSEPDIDSIEYPYDYMGLGCMILVSKMKNRMQFLAIGEREKMTYVQFFEYMMNHTQCYNEEHGMVYSMRESSGYRIFVVLPGQTEL